LLTNDEIVAALNNKASKQEVAALSKQITDLLQLLGADQYYRKPDDGIPKADLDPALSGKIDEIDDKYTRGEAIEATDLPANIATTAALETATHGMQYTTIQARHIIDEVMIAREGNASLKANLDSLSADILLRAFVATMIAQVNASTELDENEDPLLISVAKQAAQDHQLLTNRTGGEDRHAISDITGLALDLAAKAVAAAIIATINASTELDENEDPLLISGTKLDFSTVLHNDIGGRSTSEAHPTSAITGLDTILSALQGTDTALDIMAVNYGWAPGFGKSAFQVMMECMYTALASLITGNKPPCWPTFP
jgi:hypothetical protein